MTKGQRIKYKREQLGISQTELAQKIGVSKQTLYKYENDLITNIPSDAIEKISMVLECAPAYLMGWDEKERIMKYAQLLSDLPDDAIENVMKYIDFLSHTKGGEY